MEYLDLIQPVKIASGPEEYAQVRCKELLMKIAEFRSELDNPVKSDSMRFTKGKVSTTGSFSVKKGDLPFDQPIGYTEISANTEEDSQPSDDGGYRGGEHEQLINQTTHAHAHDIDYVSLDKLTTWWTKLDGGLSLLSSVDNGSESATQRVNAALTEEIFWEIDFGGGIKIVDSKIFFFSSLLWKLSFGLGDNGKEYYCYLAPAEELNTDCFVMCEFRLHCDGNIFVRSADQNLKFPKYTARSHGFDCFIDQNIQSFVGRNGKLVLSIVMMTDVGDDGALIGCEETEQQSTNSSAPQPV